MEITNVSAIALFRQSGNDNYEILAINRNKPPYVGNFALPGGKVEIGETLEGAAIRELYEETGIEIDELHAIALLNEHLFDEDESLTGHFILYYFAGFLDGNETTLTTSDEGELKWINISNLDQIEDKFVPSDFRILMDYLQKFASLGVDVMNSNQVLRQYECKVESRYDSNLDREILLIRKWQ